MIFAADILNIHRIGGRFTLIVSALIGDTARFQD